MPRPRFDKLSEARRHEILEAAAREFALHGYEGASLNRILQSVKASKGAFYYYFDDKADLFATVSRFAFRDLFGGERRHLDLGSLEQNDFWPQLERWFVESLERLHELPWLAGLGKLLYHPPDIDGVDAIVAEHFAELGTRVASLLERGRALGAVRSDLPLDLQQAMLMGAIEGADRWFVTHWESLTVKRREELSRNTFEIARRMLAPPRPGDYEDAVA